MRWFLFASSCFPVCSNDSQVCLSCLPDCKLHEGRVCVPLRYPSLLAVCLEYIWCSRNIYGLTNDFSFMKTVGEVFFTHQTVSGVGWWGCGEARRLLWSVTWSSLFGRLFGNIPPSGKSPPKSSLWRYCLLLVPKNVHGSAAYNNSVLGTIYILCVMGCYAAYYQKKSV